MTSFRYKQHLKVLFLSVRKKKIIPYTVIFLPKPKIFW